MLNWDASSREPPLPLRCAGALTRRFARLPQALPRDATCGRCRSPAHRSREEIGRVIGIPGRGRKQQVESVPRGRQALVVAEEVAAGEGADPASTVAPSALLRTPR